MAAKAVRRTILVVDDDASIRTMLAYLFEDDGYEVREASDGAEALDALEADPPDCMVLDLMMPNVDGVGVLQARGERELAPQTRVLVLTAKTDPQDAVWCWELGADEFMNKPVDPDRLSREVRLLLARTPAELRSRREAGLADARARDRLEAAFEPKPHRR